MSKRTIERIKTVMMSIVLVFFLLLASAMDGILDYIFG